MNSPNCKPLSIRLRLPSDCFVTSRTSDSGNSRPITASVCNSSFSSGGRRSMREARIACTVGGNLQLGKRPGKFHHAVTHEKPVIEQPLHRLFHEERRAFCLLDNQPA